MDWHSVPLGISKIMLGNKMHAAQKCIGKSSFVRVIHVLAQNLVHGKHVYLVLFEHRPHAVIAANYALVTWIL